MRHHGVKIKDTALADARECVDFLNSVAESWPAAGQKADILETLVKEYHPQSQPQPTQSEQSVPLGSGGRSDSTASRPLDGQSSFDQAGSGPSASGSGSAYQATTMPVNIQQPNQQTQSQWDPTQNLLATSNQSTGYPTMPWTFTPAFQQAPPPQIPNPSLGLSPSPIASGQPIEDFNDPFLYSLLNHITFPPHVPQTSNSPGDPMFMPSTEWSPSVPNASAYPPYLTQAHNQQHQVPQPQQQRQQQQQTSHQQHSQATPTGTTQYNVNAPPPGYLNQQHFAGSNQYITHAHDRRFSTTSSTGVDPSDLRNTQISPRGEMQWNEFFGSS